MIQNQGTVEFFQGKPRAMLAQGGALCNRPLTSRVAQESERREALHFYPLPTVGTTAALNDGHRF